MKWILLKDFQNTQLPVYTGKTGWCEFVKYFFFSNLKAICMLEINEFLISLCVKGRKFPKKTEKKVENKKKAWNGLCELFVNVEKKNIFSSFLAKDQWFQFCITNRISGIVLNDDSYFHPIYILMNHFSLHLGPLARHCSLFDANIFSFSFNWHLAFYIRLFGWICINSCETLVVHIDNMLLLVELHTKRTKWG